MATTSVAMAPKPTEMVLQLNVRISHRMNRLFGCSAFVLWLSIVVGLGFGRAGAQGILDSLGGDVPEGPVVTASGLFATATGDKPARLFVTATIAPEWHIYSITQKPGGPVQSKIKLTPSPDFRVGEFKAATEPESHPEPAFDNLITETHAGTITWVAAIELAPGVDPAKLEIKGNVFAQACANVCLPPKNYPFTAKIGAAPADAVDVVPPALAALPATPASPPAVPAAATPPMPSVVVAPSIPGVTGAAIPGLPAVGGLDAALSTLPKPVEGVDEFKPNDKLAMTARLEPAAVAPGGKAKLLFTAKLAPKWHIYAVDKPQATGNQATLIYFRETAGLGIGQPRPDREPIAPHGESAGLNSRLIAYFENEVTWTVDIDVPTDAKPGEHEIRGVVGMQCCDEGSNCLPPRARSFAVALNVATTSDATAPRTVKFTDELRYKTAADEVAGKNADPTAPPMPQTIGTADLTNLPPTSGYDIAQLRAQSQGQEQSTALVPMLGIGLLAGFILNFMPCVLPVIGLKVLSFVEQGGHDRRRILMLNIWYSLGIVSVFWILATIPVVLRSAYNTNFGWGQQFSFDGFNITLVSIVFVMALSFLGVWEIPIPGFAGSGGAQKAAAKEGYFGAFVKGAITTVLATPCSGPFLGTAVAFALRESAAVTYAMFTSMGLGMAAPYLLIGLKPGLIKILPKPGEWMDTFKQIMGFVLIATVLWLMVPIDAAKVMPTLVLLAGLAAGCWWIGRTPGYAETREKVQAWLGGAVFSGIVGWLAFAMPQVTDPLPWKNFKMSEFVAAVNSNKTVMVEFTADWCATCKTLKAANLDRSTTKKLVERNGVVVFEVNVDETTPEERAFFERLQPSGAVPLVAIFPADKKYEPIKFGEGYTQGQILDALDTAGPSKAGGEVAKKE